MKMIDEGLFERFPMDAIFGMHNYPTHAVGTFSICPGPMMAAFGSFECVITGMGMHSSLPQMAVDPIEIGVEIHRQWKSILHRDIDPLQPAVISITQFNSGSAQNISPEIAELKGSTRCFSPEVAATIKKRMTEIANDVCAMNNAKCEFMYKQSYPTLVNEPVCTAFAADTAVKIVGEALVSAEIEPILGAEDFACMLEKCPGAYILIGNGLGNEGGCMLHNPNFDFNDDILEIGATYWVNLATSFLKNPPL
jgi:amidohydrolase